MRSRPFTFAVALWTCLAATACGDQRPETPRATFAESELFDVLGPCHPPTDGVAAPPGIVLPTGAIVTEVTQEPPLVEVEGFVQLTPRSVREDLERRTDVLIIQSEDELIESEVLLTTGDHRTFIKATAVCVDGSSLSAVVARADDAGAVPTPTGRPR